MIRSTRRMFTAMALAVPLTLSNIGMAGAIDAGTWAGVLDEARGQTVYFNAWGGSDNINAYIKWAGDQMLSRFDIAVVQVKLDDTAKAVSTVLAEKSAGRDTQGSIDLIWINGENFAAMKRQNLLYGPD